jgi:hypothetical protein
VIYELRTYTAMPGRLADLNKRFREHTTKIWAKRDWKMVGFWTYKHGGPSDTLVYMLAWPDQATRDAEFAAFQQDPEWLAAREASEVNGPLVQHIRSDILNPTDYSPAG